MRGAVQEELKGKVYAAQVNIFKNQYSIVWRRVNDGRERESDHVRDSISTLTQENKDGS